ncbi:MAG: hypothetical protein CO021_01840 [Deltaproteobacteria bacterium CG_4_9_14_0_2_um_filter_42_21]|nr:MAG: hypothetical protein CO021_01840 [Deltaproteobacteria bacterium CG_4_9_14_0_2_um_filter_42_21]
MRISNPKTLQIAQSDFSTYFGAKEGQTGRDVQEKSTLQILGLSSIGTLASLASIALFYKMYKQSTKKAELKDFAKDVTADWTKRAANREHYLGRKDEVQRAFREIRQEYSSVIFDGASGAGKDFVAYEWFLEKERVRLGLSQNPDVPKALADAPIFEINAEAFQADTKYFGQIAEKIVAIEKQIRAETNPAEKSKLQKTLHALTLKKAREAKVVKKLHRLNALLAGETDPAKKATLEARINKLNLKLAVSVAPEISGALRSGKIIVLYMPEIDKVLLHGTSEGTSQSSQAAGMFLSLLDRYKQQVVMVGTTSRAERLQTAVDDITRRANWIKIHPFTPSKLKNVIVNGPSKAGWEKDHKVNISPEAVDAAIKLTEHFYRPTTLKPNGRYTPRFNAVASIMVSASQRAFARDGAGTAVTIEDVIAAVAEKVGKELPEAEVRETLAVTNPDTLMIDAVSGKHSIEERTKKHIRERIITLDPGLNKAEVKARTRVMSALWNRVKANVEQRNYYFDIDGFKTGDFGAPLVPASFMNITANSHEYQSQVAALESALARQASAEATSEKMKALRTELFKQPWFNGLHPERRSEIMRYALQEIQVSDPTWDHTHPLTDGFLLKLQEHLTNMESLPGRARRAVEPEGRRSSIVLSEDDGFHPAGAPRK